MSLSLLKSSIGKKSIVAVTGLILLGFVIVHMLGNLQIFLGPEWLNSYAEHLAEAPYLLWPARIILLAAILLHGFTAMQLALENKKARPIGYAKESTVKATKASLTMVISGIAILIFVVYHLLHYTFGVTNPEIFHLTDTKGRHDVYSMVVTSFQNPVVAGSYMIAMIFLGMHLSHGAGSFLQTLGLADEKTLKGIRRSGRVLGWALAIGNSLIPLSVLLGWVRLSGGGL